MCTQEGPEGGPTPLGGVTQIKGFGRLTGLRPGPSTEDGTRSVPPTYTSDGLLGCDGEPVTTTLQEDEIRRDASQSDRKDTTVRGVNRDPSKSDFED